MPQGPFGMDPTLVQTISGPDSASPVSNSGNTGETKVSGSVRHRSVCPTAGYKYGTAEPTYHKIRRHQIANQEPVTARFKDVAEFKLAKWMQDNQISQNARTEFFALEATSRMDLSYTSNYTLNEKIKKLPEVTGWTKWSKIVTGNVLNKSGKRMTEAVTMLKRNPVDAIAEIISKAEFADDLVWAPEDAFLDEARSCQIWDEMWTGREWARVQRELPEGATVVPVILASDKTHLTQHQGGKEAWPVYLSVGNLKKDTRKCIGSHAMVLIGMLPVTELKIFDEDTRGVEKKRLFHECMRELLQPLVEAGKNGIFLPCADGYTRRCFPILMAYIADNPEQCMIACCKQNRCHICTIDPQHRGKPLDPNLLSASGKKARKRDPRETIDLLLYYDSRRHRAVDFDDQGLKPFGMPFWSDLPLCDIYSCLAPDLLHQLHKGVFDHVLDWCLDAANDDGEVDRRVAALPSHPDLRHFRNGFTTLKQTTGTEHRQIQKIILGVLDGLVDNDVLNALRAILDFIYYARLPVHTSNTLLQLSDSLSTWHEHKSIFVRLGIRDTTLFEINKLHSMEHYPELIIGLGAPDGLNTELPERLHIEYAKIAYRATNRKDFAQQMCVYLGRCDQIELFDRYLEWAMSPQRTAFDSSPAALESPDARWELGIAPTHEDIPSILRGTVEAHWSLPHTAHAVSPLSLFYLYNAVDFLPEINRYLSRRHPAPIAVLTPLTEVLVFNKATLCLSDPFHNNLGDRIRAFPIGTKGEGAEEEVEGKFDTVLVRDDWVSDNQPIFDGLKGFRVAQVRAIFALPPDYGVPEPLAYVELFTAPRSEAPIVHIGLHRVRHAVVHNKRSAQVIPLSLIYRSVHLLPMFGGRNSHWDCASSNVLEVCTTFYVNRYLDEHSFMLLY
ncbi:DNA-dependent ATPase [Ceratobasidium sp. AG-Ba]|nr:DNA-dependent ATPase [Ceratobasidium sp. AG-Ba]